MSAETLQNIIPKLLMALSLIAAGAAWFYGYVLLKKDLKQKLLGQYRMKKEESYRRIRKNVKKRMEYDAIVKELYALGVKYYLGDGFSPFDYNVVRMAMAVGGGTIALLLHPLLIPFLTVGGYLFLPAFYRARNKSDNSHMMEDMRNIYGIVTLQIGNGVYISKVIYECASFTKNKRLSKALLEFSIDIENFSSVEDACDRFRMKFDCNYIEIFAKSIAQAQNTGNLIQLFEDMQRKIAGINEAIFIRKEDAVKNISFLFITLIFLAGGLMLVYIIVTQYFSKDMLLLT